LWFLQVAAVRLSARSALAMSGVAEGLAAAACAAVISNPMTMKPVCTRRG